MRYKGLDLNLLVALDVLIDERNVSRAAERLNMSQPAMSAALSRLRTFFDDPILSSHGKRMIPTAHALSLRPMLADLLGRADALISVSTAFDPARSRRHFRVGASDYLATVLFNPLIASIQQAAPHVTIEVVAPFDGQATTLDQGQLDVLITPEEHISPNHPARPIFVEEYVVAGWSANPIFDRPLTEEAFFSSGHVVVEIGRSRTAFAETALRGFGDRRRVEIVVASFLLAPEMLVNTDRLTVMQKRLAVVFAKRLPIRFTPMPFPFPVMREMIQFNRARTADPGLTWLIDQIMLARDHPVS